jgi:hypothetical protein
MDAITDLQERIRATAAEQVIEDARDPRTAEQRDADQDAAEWRETYQSLLP